MNKCAAILVLTLLMLSSAFAQTEYLSVDVNEQGFFDRITDTIGSTAQEFLTFPQELKPGQKFDFISLLFTTQDAYDVHLVYDFYQGGRLVDTITVPMTQSNAIITYESQNIPSYSPSKILTANTRFKSGLGLRFGLDKYKPGAIGVQAYLFGTKVKYTGNPQGRISTLDEREFTLANNLDCSYRVNTCAQQGQIGIVNTAAPNPDNSACVEKTVTACASGTTCKTVNGQASCVKSCTPTVLSNGQVKCTRSGGECSTAGKDTCGNSCFIASEGKTCSGTGTCRSNNCLNTCQAGVSGEVDPCVTFDKCGDVLKTKPNGVKCVPNPSSPPPSYQTWLCSDKNCVLSASTPPTQPTAPVQDPNVPPPAPEPTAEEGNPDGSPKSTYCTSGREYPVGDQMFCGTPPEGYCLDDVACGSGRQCQQNFCADTPAPQGQCVKDLEVDCSDGSKIVTEICDNGNYVPTEQTCPIAQPIDGGDVLEGGNGASPYDRDYTEDGVETSGKSTAFIIGGIVAAIIIGGVVVSIMFPKREKKSKRKR